MFASFFIFDYHRNAVKSDKFQDGHRSTFTPWLVCFFGLFMYCSAIDLYHCPNCQLHANEQRTRNQPTAISYLILLVYHSPDYPYLVLTPSSFLSIPFLLFLPFSLLSHLQLLNTHLSNHLLIFSFGKSCCFEKIISLERKFLNQIFSTLGFYESGLVLSDKISK